MTARPDAQTSLEKALDVCEALAGAQRGLTVTELARALKQPAPTVHRLLAVLKRRGYVRQDEDTSRYSLTLKMLDMSFRLLGRSELRLHAYPVLREHVLRTGTRAFIAVPAGGEVTYLWSAGRTRWPCTRPTAARCRRTARCTDGAQREPAPELHQAASSRATPRSGDVVSRPFRRRVGADRCSCCPARARRCTTTRGARSRGSASSPTRADERPICAEHDRGGLELARHDFACGSATSRRPRVAVGA